MNKSLKILLKVLGAIILLGGLFYFVVGPIMKTTTKKHSPEVIETYSNNGLNIEVFYCSPAKKDRIVFGELVPYNEVWRTGANEASTFSTSEDLLIDGKTLPAGKYSLWTLPREDNWDIIFNNKMYGWGVRFQDSKAMREAEYDALVVNASVSKSYTAQENFSIKLVESTNESVVMLFAWDQVAVALPMQKK